MRSQILLVASDPALRRALTVLLQAIDAALLEAPTDATLSRFFENRRPDLVILGPAFQHPWDALAIAHRVRQWTRTVPIVVVTAHGSEELAIAAMRAGVCDYFKAPLDVREFGERLRQLLQPPAPAVGSASRSSRATAPPLIGSSREAAGIRKSMQQIAATDSTVLITGETGTGKELAAQLIHDSSRRAPHPFVSINCAAIPEGLLESELFGFERGAFTGAAASSSGRLTAAHRGTLLLDEIGDMTPATQAKVLQLVEEKTVNRLGTTRTTRLDARVLAATHQDLPVLMDDGRFRPDLYFRLNVARLHLPPLRERAADIPELLSHYLPVACEGLQRDVEAFSDEAVDLLTRYEWPGNIRELKNVVERLVIHASSRTITAGDLEEVVNPITLRPVARETKQATLLSALVSAGGNKTEAARALGCSRMTVYRRLAEYTAARKMGR